MGYEKFTWLIKNFSSSQSMIWSNNFVIGGCKWFLLAYPNGNISSNHLSLYLVPAGYKLVPSRKKIHTKVRLSVVNQVSKKLSQRRETQMWIDQMNLTQVGFSEMILLTKLNAKNGGFLVKDEVKIIAEVDVLEVIGNLDFSKESQEVTTQPLKRTKINDDIASVKESIDVNGFQVLPSQGESVKRIFERHPDMALEFRAKNQHMRTSCINLLLNIIETLCQPLQDFSIDDLSQAKKALTYLKDSGFKVDWLERKLDEVKEKKMEEQIDKTRVQELEEELKIFKQKCFDTEALLEKEKTEVLAASRAPPLTLDDVV